MIIEDSRNLPLNRLLLFALRCKPLVEIFPHPSYSFCKFPMKMFLYERKKQRCNEVNFHIFFSLFAFPLSSYLISWQMKAFYNSHGKK